ncbi:MAG: LD-carboxypeptidase [Lentimicrobium sp.]|jgi:muramoyltetrapeptide carboxypeptidase|nr:LD-carboxypeptidase [Lentimicrobium sp.]
MITPEFLKPGDKVAIVATARKISPAEVESAVKTMESWGLEVVIGDSLFAEDRQFAGNDMQRTNDFQAMLDHPEIRAIICARGGYGTVRIIDGLDFSSFIKHPKWIVGYSDITVLHNHINNLYGIETLHATMPVNFPVTGELPAVEALKYALFGESPDYKIKTGMLSRSGHARGEVVGGNLSILYSLSGTPSSLDTQGKILFIEDLDEYLYHIDRMMMNLKRSGKLENLAGLVVGGLTDMRDNSVPYGMTAEEIVADAVKPYKFPVLFGIPAGHIKENMPLIMGREAVLDVNAECSALTFTSKANSSKTGKFKSQVKPLVFILGFFALLYILYALLLGKM